jgi:multisubunit Na+/H+ antiporter MnhF subunit
MLLFPDSWTMMIFSILYIEPVYRGALLVLALINSILAIVVERFIIVGWLTRYDVS